MSALLPQAPGIPLPVPTRLSQPFWDGCRAGELRHQRCRTCQTCAFDPAYLCRACGSAELAWETGSGRGHLYSWSVVWRPQTPAFTVPYAAAIVELEEGHHMVTNVIGCQVADLYLDLPLQVEFHPMDDQIWLPYFRPVAP